MSGALEIENWYWIPDNEEYLLPGLLTETTSKHGLFRLENGKEVRKTTQELQGLQMLDSQCLEKNISNLIELHHLSENAVLHVLRNRFRDDHIYTFVSSILVAVNPFRDIPIYGNDWIEKYHSTDHRNLPPHIFVTADNAYNYLIRNYLSQSIVISGESGSGKTESIKLILKYITQISRKNAASHRNIQEQILQANPVMEAFGNAKTSRNNNSSRFGKLITLRFSGGAIDEAGIISYLLEKCRVAHHQEGERNFHIFYQLIAATVDDPELARYLGMTNSNVDYAYARRDEVGSVASINDLEGFREVSHALKVLGVPDYQRNSIYRIIAGVLLLGNIEFSASSPAADAAARLTSVSSLEYIADSLGLSFHELQRCFTSRNFGVRSIVTCLFTIPQAIDARDAFAKKLYSLLFDYLIAFINSTLRSHGKRSDIFIAILDIFGFEAFELNSFEQLLINYCNEKLQFHFNNYIFLMEQQEYAREGVNVSVISYIDNSATLELLERKGVGILSMIDEEISVPKGSDDTLLNKILKTHGSHPNVKRAKPSGGDNSFKNKFIISHYAGDVGYNIIGFLDKNKDTVSPDLYQIGLTSSDPFIQELFQRGAEDYGGGGRKHVSASAASKKTLGSQFKTQLASLIDTLNQTEPHFVRCMKSNMEKVGRKFDSHVMLTQLRYSGLIEVCRIRQNGFPHRLTFEKFLRTYWMLHSSSKTAPELAKSLERNGYYSSEQYFIGHSKIFLKFETGLLLEQARNAQVGSCAVKFQRIIRGWMARRRLFYIFKTLTSLKRALATKDKSSLQDSLTNASKYMFNQGRHLPIVCEARNLYNRLDQENATNEMLSNALRSMDYDLLENAVKIARNMKPPLSSPLVKDCMNAMKDLKNSIANLNSKSSPVPRANSPPPPIPTGPALLSSVANRAPAPPPPSKVVPSKYVPSPDPQPPLPNKFDPSNYERPPPPPPPPSADVERGRQPRRSLMRQESHSLSPMRRPGAVPLPPPRRKSPPKLESVAYLEKFETPIPLQRSGRTSILTRQLSRDDMADMTSLHETIAALVDASNSEDGLTDNDIRPLENLLNEFQSSGNQLTQQVSDLMMAKEELFRAKQQLELQNKLLAVTAQTPQWKTRNLLVQANKVGMNNFHVVKHFKRLFEEKEKNSKDVAAFGR